jgi:hypothetical protein
LTAVNLDRRAGMRQSAAAVALFVRI